MLKLLVGTTVLHASVEDFPTPAAVRYGNIAMKHGLRLIASMGGSPHRVVSTVFNNKSKRVGVAPPFDLLLDFQSYLPPEAA